MNARLTAPNEILALNARLFLNCLDGVDDETARKRPDGKINNMVFVAAHLVDARHFLLGVLGVKLDKPFGGTLEGVNNINDVREYPSLEDVRSAWEKTTIHLKQRIAELTDSDLDEDSKHPFPSDDKTALGCFAFLMQHESYHIGQLALLRKQLGLSAMSYS